MKATMLVGQISISTFFVFCLLTASANALDATDATRLDGLVRPGVPTRWNELYQILPNTRRIGVGWEPAGPLILAARWEASMDQKRERLVEHIRWAHKHGALDTVANFLRSLPETRRRRQRNQW
jgi:hypothetical protein